MEIPASLAAGTGGGPLGTERSSAISPHASGEAFAREVERASERVSGTGAEARRKEELASTRREARRAGFGREREAESEARPVEAHFRGEHAPVVARPAVAAEEQSSAPVQTPAGGQASSSPPGSDGSPSSIARPSEAPPGLVVPSTNTTNASSAIPAPTATTHAAPELAPARAQNPAEPAPVELAQILRTSAARSAKLAAATATPGAPDAAMLERAAEILRQIRLHTAPGVQRLTLELEPAELGRLSVQLALRAGKVNAIVRAESAATLDALRQREDELHAVLAQRGMRADSLRFELGFGGSRSRGHERARAAAEEPRARVAPAPEHPSLATPRRPAAARLDTYA